MCAIAGLAIHVIIVKHFVTLSDRFDYTVQQGIIIYYHIKKLCPPLGYVPHDHNMGMHEVHIQEVDDTSCVPPT